MTPPLLDPRRLPPCHRCHAPAVVVEIAPGLNNVTWCHEHWCRVPDNPADRAHLAMLMAAAYEAKP